ncbi:hypothetical protein G9E11_01795 [Arthrobacter sp. IA7]|uniref:hypothetical protein n=1 Tax=Arthrobacter ipis TaxID=2716202 RepID=UPI00168869B7|nr:hypothetical protein [Arthrobacter ipis]MBD1541006.1 hypothetical protein [Arthrobacter ipis]
MNKPLVATLLTSAILTLAAPSIGAPPNVSVTGAGTLVFRSEGTVHVTVSAHKPADAPEEEGTGNVTIKFPGEPAVHGTVDCLSVEGDNAGVSGQLDNGQFFFITITDGEQTGVPDRADVRRLVATRQFCPAKHGSDDIINGNFQVRG